MSEITPPANGATPAGRYGAPASRRTKIVFAVMLGVGWAIALGLLLWIALHYSNPSVRGTLLGYEVTSDRSVEVRFEVWRKPGVTAQCVVRARNAEGVEVGSRVITIPPGERQVVLTEVLETRARAISGEFLRCDEAATG